MDIVRRTMEKQKIIQSKNYMQYQDQYLEQKILSASPKQLIAYIYDAAIVSCTKRDIEKTTAAIGILINSLNFDDNEDVQDISLKFIQYYEYILDLVRKNNFDEARDNLKEIRDAWVKSMKVY
tara:strand:+ start:172 stop:540 length:369 start_codon:yes stop_codon:yes gene_type:complete